MLLFLYKQLISQDAILLCVIQNNTKLINKGVRKTNCWYGATTQ